MAAIKAYLDRSLGVIRQNTAQVLRMDITPNPPPLTLISFTSLHQPVDQISNFATGSDADIGGLSTCNLTAISTGPSSSSSTASTSSAAVRNQVDTIPQEYVAFHGNLSLKVPPSYTGRIRTGYAAFRNKTRPTIFGEQTWDLGLYTHLRVVVGYRGWEGWRSRWVFNIQTDGPVRSDLFQHRLDIPPSPTSTNSPLPLEPHTSEPPQFSTLHLPLSSFVLTNSGQTASTQIPMMRDKIRTLGFALLGGGRTEEGSAPPPVAEDLKRLGAGGWGKGGGEVTVDRELEDLIASDQPHGSTSNRRSDVSGSVSRPTGAYHRVGSTATSDAVSHSQETEAVAPAAQAEAEGYYELCIKSVEAVKWDPEADGEST